MKVKDQKRKYKSAPEKNSYENSNFCLYEQKKHVLLS